MKKGIFAFIFAAILLAMMFGDNTQSANLPRIAGLDSSHVTDGGLHEPDLKISNSPTDNYMLTYDQATNGFSWASAAGGGAAVWESLYTHIDTLDILEVYVFEFIDSTTAKIPVATSAEEADTTDGGATRAETSKLADSTVAVPDSIACLDIKVDTRAVIQAVDGDTVIADGRMMTKNGSAGAGMIDFFEDSDNGSNYVRLIGPASTADITLTLPSSDGDNTQILQSDGSGVLSWTSNAAGAAVWDSLYKHYDTLDIVETYTYEFIDTTTAQIPVADSTVAVPDSIACLAIKADTRVKVRSLDVDTLVGPVWCAFKFNFGMSGSVLEIPNSANPTTDEVGEIAWNDNYEGIETYSGDESESVVISIYDDKDAVIFAPDGVNDELYFMHVNALRYPGGIEIDSVSITLPGDAAYSMVLEEWSGDPPTYGTTISTVTTGAGDAYASEVPDTDADIAANAFIYLDIPATDVDWVAVKIIFHIN